jgi:hypothetical protein
MVRSFVAPPVANNYESDDGSPASHSHLVAFTRPADSTYNAFGSMTRPAFTIVAERGIALSGGLCIGVGV